MEIACWFHRQRLQSLLVMLDHVPDEPYRKLQRALKAEIDEDAWATSSQHCLSWLFRGAVDRQQSP